MRFEVVAAYALGVLLPLAEVMRRGRNVESITAYADDFIVGALLLVAAWSVSQRKAWGNGLLAGAWGVLCGGLYYSFFGQLERGGNADPSGLPNNILVAIKGVIYIIALTALVRAVRATHWSRSR